MSNYISFVDLFLIPIYFLIIYLISNKIVSNNNEIIDYKFFKKRLIS